MHEWQEEVGAIYEKWRQSEIAEGRREGEAALRDVLIAQLKQRFGSVPESALARVGEADIATLKRWGSRVLTAASLDDVLA
jgi:hypothetical protein